MKILPRHEEAVIPIRKFTEYALNLKKQPHKTVAFDLALGYNLENVPMLIAQIRANLGICPAVIKGDAGFGQRYEVSMNIVGANGKTAKVLTGWIDDALNGEMRLTSAYVDK